MEELLTQFSDYINSQVAEFPAYFGNGNKYRYWIYNSSDKANKERPTITTFAEAKSFPCVSSYSTVQNPAICHGPFLHNLEHEMFRGKSNSVFISYINKNFKFTDRTHNYGQCNFMWLTKEQLQDHINYCKEALQIEFEFVIKESKCTYTVLYDFKGLSHLQVKFVLFWVRYAWEYPSNLALFDAMVLKKIHPEEEMFNLLSLASGVHSRLKGKGDAIIYSSQCICNKPSKFMKIEDVIKKLKATSTGYIEYFFKEMFPTDMPAGDKICLVDQVTRTAHLNRWSMPENVDKRLRYYDNVLIPAAKR